MTGVGKNSVFYEVINWEDSLMYVIPLRGVKRLTLAARGLFINY